MDRTRAAKCEDRQGARIVSSLRRVNTRGARHVVVDLAVNRPGDRFDIRLERIGDAVLQCCPRRIDIESHLAAEKVVGVEIPEDEVSVRDGRLVPTTSITSGARRGTRRFRDRPRSNREG